MNTFCRQCGARLAEASRFCDACGTPAEVVGVRVAGLATTAPSTTPQPLSAAAAQPATAAGAVAAASPSAGLRPGLKWGLAGGALAVLLGVGYVVATPWLVLANWRELAERQSFEELVDRIGRSDLESVVVSSASGALARVKTENREAGVRSSVELELLVRGVDDHLQKVVQELLKPASLRQLAAVTRPGGPAGQDRRGEQQQAQAHQEWERFRAQLLVSTRYTGLNRFRVDLMHPEFGVAWIELARDGLIGWRLADADLSEPLAMLGRLGGMAASPYMMFHAEMANRRWDAAARWLRVPAPGGRDPLQEFMLAVFDFEGVGGATTPPQVALQRMAAAAMGNPRAAYVVARVHSDGLRVPADLTAAKTWFGRAFEFEPVDLWANAIVYLHARRGDWNQAREWHQKAAQSQPFASRRPQSFFQQRQRLEARERLLSERSRAIEDLAGPDAKTPSADLLNGAWLHALAAGSARSQTQQTAVPAVGPLHIGMTLDAALTLLGPPQSVVRRELLYQSVFPRATLRLHFSPFPAALERLELSVDPTWQGPIEGVLAGFAQDVKAAGRAAATAGNQRFSACPVSAGDLLEFIASDGELLMGTGERYQGPGLRLDLCADGRVSFLALAARP